MWTTYWLCCGKEHLCKPLAKPNQNYAAQAFSDLRFHNVDASGWPSQASLPAIMTSVADLAAIPLFLYVIGIFKGEIVYSKLPGRWMHLVTFFQLCMNCTNRNAQSRINSLTNNVRASVVGLSHFGRSRRLSDFLGRMEANHSLLRKLLHIHCCLACPSTLVLRCKCRSWRSWRCLLHMPTE